MPIAIRVYPVLPRRRSRPQPKHPFDGMLVWDVESRTDLTQRLTFGCYRFIEDHQCLTEHLFAADDLTRAERRVLAAYCRSEPADVDPSGVSRLALLTPSEFLDRFFDLAYRGRVLVVTFNGVFDISRLAHDVAEARGEFAGGFSLGLWTFEGTQGPTRDQFRPRLGIKHIDNRRAMMGFTARREPDVEDLIPDGSETGEPERGYKFRGHFLDCKTLAFALTDQGHSLRSACDAFGVENPKEPTAQHGTITADYIDYNRNDVLATWQLADKLLEEYDKHPIDLPVTQVYSPASIGRAYLRAMGIQPILERQPDFPSAILGHAQSAFWGGRTSAHIRKIAVPIVFCDYLSMYGSVNSLLRLWRFVIAREIRVVRNCRQSIIRLLHKLAADPNRLFSPKTWPLLTAFVRLRPNGDVLPVRARFSDESPDWQVAVSHVHSGPAEEFWYALPDVVASVLLTGRVPDITDAFRLEPEGTLPDLTTVKLRGTVAVDPRREDFFKVVIEQRQRLSKRTDLSDLERKRLDKALKVLANATSYGIYAEMHRRDSDRVVNVECHGIDEEPYTCRVAHPDERGDYCFPPLAALITAAARLMLATLEREVTAAGGTYAMEDTDSMAIVATKRGGLVACPGGPHRLPDGRAAIKALSWADVDRIASRFATLNPYDRSAVSGSILKIEKDNFDPETGQQRQLWCLAISAKRYALFLQDSKGTPTLLREGENNHEDRWSEHGLGHLLNPRDLEDEDRDWIADVWLRIVRRALGLSTKPSAFGALPAIGRLTVSSPTLWQPFERFNSGKPFSRQVKPFNFLITSHVRPFGHPAGMVPQHFQLVAPYETDPARWLTMSWLDRHSAKPFHITTAGDAGDRRTARVSTYHEMIEDYAHHPESKCADASGQPSDRQTVGLLYRRHVSIAEVHAIGKESNSLEEVEAGVEHDLENLYTEYQDPRRTDWARNVLPAVQKEKLSVLVKACAAMAKACGGKLSRRALIDIRAERSTPHPKNQKFLASVMKTLGRL